MIRTQVSLDEREYGLAKKHPAGHAPWMKFAGLVETGDSRSSQSVDDLVYGQKD
ncbi:MAG: CopG family transcriptional regulator [Acidobacteria bacterium]|nr:CopG family transcriptional regulator [Acidobacteriota bacterium]